MIKAKRSAVRVFACITFVYSAVALGFLVSRSAPTAQPALDREIIGMIGRADVNRVASVIHTLAAIPTRNACSDNTGSGPGIGSARDFILAEMQALPGVEAHLFPYAQTGCAQ